MPNTSAHFRGFFVTGTDTGVGKTFVTAAIATALREIDANVGVMKPIETGVPPGSFGEDATALAAAAGCSHELSLISPLRYTEPAAPSVAAEQEHTAVDMRVILAAYHTLQNHHEWLLVEGAGGLAVPIGDQMTMATLAQKLALPVLIVSRPNLGTINHSVLTAHYAQHHGLTVAGFVVNNMPEEPTGAERTCATEIERLSGLPVLCVLPAVDRSTSRERFDDIMLDVLIPKLRDIS